MENFNYDSRELELPIRPPGHPDAACASARGGVGYGQGVSGGMGFAFDEEYVRRLSEGDSLIENHFLSYFDKLLHIKLRRKLRTREAIDDARQETFKRVFAALREGPGIRDPRRLGAFVNGTCENVLRERFRDRVRNPHSDRPAPEKVDPCVRPDSRMVRDEIAEQVHRTLERLPEQDRDLLRAVFLAEQDREEICREFGVSRGYLRVVLHRAKERFRQTYDESIAREARALRGRLGPDGPGPRPHVAD